MVNKKRGIGLLELILVLVVVAVILVLAAKRYKVYEFQTDVLNLQKTVNTLKYAYNDYYLQHCATGWSGSKTINFNNLGISLGKVPNPFGPAGEGHYLFSTKDTSIPGQSYKNRKLVIKIPFNSQYHANLDYFQGHTNASAIYPSSSSGQGLEWTFSPFKPGVSNDPSDPAWLNQIRMRKFMGKYQENNPCWFPTN